MLVFLFRYETLLFGEIFKSIKYSNHIYAPRGSLIDSLSFLFCFWYHFFDELSYIIYFIDDLSATRSYASQWPLRA